MIRVNLLPQRKAKRGFTRTSSPGEPSGKHAIVGIIALGAAAAGVFFAVDMPKRQRLAEVGEANKQLQQQINEKNKALQGYAELKKAEEEAKERAESINRLLATKVVPAHVLHELGRVLTHEGPTMTESMAKLAGNTADGDPNKRFLAEWDPSHVWMTSFIDKDGKFVLDGGAQSESDVTQLSKRLAASVYFMDVTPAGGERIQDKESGLAYYKFTITGKVAY
jgi:Tfp pilus assembly protein PilN